jgi:GNAT superfamily N-acetyltransferase
MTLSRTDRRSSGSVRELVAASEVEAAQRLRYTVWRSEGVMIHHSERESIADHHDDHATHWGVFDGDQLVGAARLCLHDELDEAPDAELFVNADIPAPVASMNRLVVLKSYRGRGIGGLLDHVRIQKARELSARTVIIAPVNVDSRKKSLSGLGFHVLSKVTGHAKWSPTVEICFCYLVLSQVSAVDDV